MSICRICTYCDGFIDGDHQLCESTTCYLFIPLWLFHSPWHRHQFVIPRCFLYKGVRVVHVLHRCPSSYAFPHIIAGGLLPPLIFLFCLSHIHHYTSCFITLFLHPCCVASAFLDSQSSSIDEQVICPHHPSSYYSSRYPELHSDIFPQAIHPPFTALFAPVILRTQLFSQTIHSHIRHQLLLYLSSLSVIYITPYT